jgi:hypothetical protein
MSVTRSQILFVSIVLAIVLGFWGWGKYHDLSGTYVTQDENSVHMLRLVETDGSKLSGQFESVILDNSGKIKDATAAIVGTTDNNNVNLTLNVSPLIPVPLTAFGLHGWNSLTLTFSILGELPKTRIYTSSDLSAFQLASDKLRKKSQEILAEQSAAETRAKLEQQKEAFITAANKLAQEMQSMDSRIDTALQKLPDGDAHYHRITSKVQSYLEKAQGLPGNRYDVTRSQIIVAMNQGVVATNQVNIQVEATENDFRSNAEPLLKQLAQAEQSCPAQNTSVNSACRKLQDGGVIFKSKCKAMLDMLAQLNKSYQTELASQQAMIDRASQIR